MQYNTPRKTQSMTPPGVVRAEPTTLKRNSTSAAVSTTSTYDELKIRDGPVYAISAPERNISKECLTEYEQQVLQQEQKQQQQQQQQQCTASSSSSPTTTTAATPSAEDYFASHTPSPCQAEKTALLIVDVQPEYWGHCPAVRKDFADFPSNLAKTIEICRQRRAKIIWVRADYRYSHSPWLVQFERIRGPRNLGEVPCDPHSEEFRWEEFATPVGGEVIIAKSSWSSTSNTALMDILRVAGIETVLVCGLITSVCVQHSAFGTFEAGYRTLLVSDACADRGRARHEAALALYGDYMYELVTSADLEDEETGLRPAEPVWLSLDTKTNMVRANSFPKQVEASVGATTTTTSSINHHPNAPRPDPVVLHQPPVKTPMRTNKKSHNNDRSSNNNRLQPPSSPKIIVAGMDSSSTSSIATTVTSSSDGDVDVGNSAGNLGPPPTLMSTSTTNESVIHVR